MLTLKFNLKKQKLILLVYLLFFLIVFIVLFSRAVSRGIGHDEYQFVASAQLFKSHFLLPYLDYPFLHMPYMPVINGIILFFSTHDLLTLRASNTLITFMSSLLIFALVFKVLTKWQQFYRLLFSGLAVILFIFNPALVTMDGYVLNHALPILLSLITFWLYSNLQNFKHINRAFLLAGLFSGLAIGIRLNFTVLIIPFVFVILFDNSLDTQKKKVWCSLKYFLGLLGALFPAGVLFLSASKQFYYGNFVYILLNTNYRISLGYETAMTLSSKIEFFFKDVLNDPATITLYLLTLGIVLYAAIRWIRTKDTQFFQILLLFIYSLVFLATSFSPTPSWLQYFFAPVPFLILSLFWGAALIPGRFMKFGWIPAICIIVVLIFNPAIKNIAPQIALLSKPDNWIPIRFHKYSQELVNKVNCQSLDCKILTFMPIIPLEVDAGTYPMFTVGTFSWRTSPLLSRQRREAYQVISFFEIDDFLDNDPPDAILTGTEAGYDGFTIFDPGGLDQSFVDYALRNNYRPISIPDTLYGSKEDYILYVK